MKKRKIYTLLGIITIIVILVIFWGITSAPKIEAPVAEELGGKIAESDIVYFCSNLNENCRNMEKYFIDNKTEDKIFFTKKDITSMKNPEYAKEHELIGEGCALDEKKIGGIPFLYAQGKCYVGESEVKSFFEKKLNDVK